MSEPVLSVRSAVAEDAAQVLVWRNDPVTRSMSRTSDLLQPEAHARWWSAAVLNPDTLLLIGLHHGQSVGVIGFERRAEGAWEASMHLRPESRGQGLAAPLLTAAIAAAFPDGAPPLLAEIKPDNLGSRRVFERCGFRACGEVEDVLLYERRL